MGNKSFDDLLQAIQSALLTAQDAMNKKRQEAVRKLYEVDETGATRSPVFAFSIPRDGADKDENVMFSLPASSFRMYHRPRISMLSLEFACELKEGPLSGGLRVYTLVVKSSKKGWWQRKNRRRMRIIFDGTDQPSGEARLDGELLMEIPRYCGAAGGRSITVTKRSIFLALLDRLRNLWPSQKFDMTGEQAKRAREILSQSDSDKPVHGEAETSKKAAY